MTTPKPVALPAWDRLMDSDWVNIVNAQSVKDEGSYTHGAVCEAVKLCEARLRELNEPQIASALSAIAMHRAEEERLREELARTERNRDMWKGQVERQASKLARLHDVLLEGARRVEDLKLECGMDPESPTATQNGRYMSVSYFLRAALKETP